MRHFLTTEDWSRAELQTLLDDAETLRTQPSTVMAGKVGAWLFLNPSLRTRTSFQVAASQLGGTSVVLDAASGWGVEVGDGVVMDGENEEHAKEAVRVLSRYCDVIGLRAFPKFQNWAVERQDAVLNAFAAHSEVPIVNMETIIHPCQELALMRAIQQRFQQRGWDRPDKKKFLLTWVPHPKGLNTAVANSALMIATKFGMDVTMLCPNEDYVLDERFMAAARANAAEHGGSVTVTHDIASAYDGAHVVYAKSWGALRYIGRQEEERPIREAHKHFIVDEEKMARTDGGLFSHCLPMRRNVKVTDAVADGPSSMILEEAENRLHVQKAILNRLLRQPAA